MEYVITDASCHDWVVAETVMIQIPHPYNLGDKGYINQTLQKSCTKSTEFLFGRLFGKISESLTQRMETVDEMKTQSGRNRTFDFS